MSIALQGGEAVASSKEGNQTRRDRLYLFDTGILYIGACSAREVKRPREASISIAISHRPLEIRTQNQTLEGTAIAVKSLTGHTVNAAGVPYASVFVAPDHPHFRAFHAIPSPGTLVLKHNLFRAFDNALLAAYEGRLPLAHARDLFETIVATAAELLPPVKPLDPRIERVLARLQRSTGCPLEELADSVYLSYHRMSHLFSENLGLSLRSYQLWIKLHRAIALMTEGHKQTDVAARAGFTDAAHFHRVCYEAYGFRPSFLINSEVRSLRSVSLVGK